MIQVITSSIGSDISFEVDNGIVYAHKALLMARCEMMYAMFNNDFIESASDVVSECFFSFTLLKK